MGLLFLSLSSLLFFASGANVAANFAILLFVGTGANEQDVSNNDAIPTKANFSSVVVADDFIVEEECKTQEAGSSGAVMVRSYVKIFIDGEKGYKFMWGFRV